MEDKATGKESDNPFAGLVDLPTSTDSDLEIISAEYDRSDSSTPTSRSTRQSNRRATAGKTTPGNKEDVRNLKRKTPSSASAPPRKLKTADAGRPDDKMSTGKQDGDVVDMTDVSDRDPFQRMQEWMGAEFKKTNDNISNMNVSMGKINEKVNVNARNLERLRDSAKKDADKCAAEIRALRGIIDEKNAEREKEIAEVRASIGDDGRSAVSCRDSVGSVSTSDWKEKEYLKARKQARFWPIVGNSESELWTDVERFLNETMRIPSSVISESDVVNVTRIPPRARGRPASEGGRARVEHDEVIITFASVKIRVAVCSYSRNLADHRSSNGSPTAGVRMEIPEHLAGVHQTLLQHGSMLRRRHGQSFKRNIKYDDTEQTLYMDIRLPGDVDWLRVDYSVAVEERRAERMRESSRTRSRLTSSQSDYSENDVAEPPAKRTEREDPRPRWGDRKR